MPVSRLGLFDLLAPQYLAGIQLPQQIHEYLSILGVDEFNSFYTDSSVVYTGIASFSGAGSGGAEMVYEEPSGTRFTWEKGKIHFRMIIPRDGAEFIDEAVNDFSPGDTTKLPDAAALLNDLRAAGNADMDADTDPATPETEALVVDYPAVAFRLELLVDILNFSLGEDWKPGIINPSDNRIKVDPDHANDRVLISLPKVLFSYTQGDDDDDLKPAFKIESWGVAGFDAPQDLAMGELIRMRPSIAVHKSEHVAFSIDEVIIDASKESTPPQIMEHFGVDEEWEGLYIGQALIYYSNDQGVGFNFRVKDALISFSGEVSLEAALDIYLNETASHITTTPVFYNGAERVTSLVRGIVEPPVETVPSGTPGGSVTVRQNAVMQLQIEGGMPAYTVHVWQGATDLWDSNTRQATFATTGPADIFIAVHDSSTGTILRSAEHIRVTVEAASTTVTPPDGTSADRPDTEPLEALQPFNISGNDTGHELLITANGSSINLEVRGAGDFSLDISGSQTRNFRNQRNITLNVPNDTNLALALAFDHIPANTVIADDIRFNYNKPANATELDRYANLSINDGEFIRTYPTASTHFPDPATVNSIQLEGWASLEVFSNGTTSGASRDQELSRLRCDAVKRAMQSRYSGVTFNTPILNGHNSLPNSSEPFDRNNPNHTNDENRLVKIRFNSREVPAVNITATIVRPPHTGTTTPTTPATTPSTPPAAPPLPNSVPPVIKQLGIRVKIERNMLSLLELYGKVDFQTEMEDKIRTGAVAAPPPGGAPDTAGSLDMQHGNQADGIIDFKVCYQYDRATNETTLIFKLHSDEADTDGLLHMDNEGRTSALKNIFGALLLFAPIINSAATAVGSNVENPGAWMLLGASLAVPVFIGAAGVFLTRKVILYGGEARTRFVTPAPGEPLRSLDLGLVFDYEVQFDIVCASLGIGLNRTTDIATSALPPPLRARYKAIGFNINYSDTPTYKGFTYTPVFDASRGYDLDLSDPSLFQLPAPLGDLFNIVGARLARFNPVTLEIDFAIKVDLGIITVDKFKLKIPIDPGGAPQIIPSGVKVNIPGVLTGNGFVEIVDTEIADKDGNKAIAKGVEGGLDLTLVSLKIRIAANIGVGTLKDMATGREAVSVFLGMTVKFPTPIILGATGLGIYGFMGLFAMHYRRLEDPNPDPTKAVGPALNWLIKADGDPTRLRTKNGDSAALALLPTGPKLWEMAFDRWSFGIGVLMGTAEGGMLVNMQGMLVLELPGPRILIMVKVQIVTPLPGQPPTPAKSLETGILGIVDIDFGKQQLTLGVMLNFSIEQVLALTIPIELFFKWDNPSNWHLYLGTIAQPASATILDIIRGSAYLMIQGNELVYADYGSKVPAFLQDKRLNGIAIAIGLEASIILGSESSGVYLKIAAGAHLGVSFAPFLVVGTMYFTGKLRLVIISIGATGSFDVLVTKQKNRDELKVYMHGEVCGSIDLFFFEISACIGITIGDEDFDIEAPKLVRGVYLQSFSPVLSSGQGSTKPIDASLGNAFDTASGAIPADLLTVPIDSLPVIQLHASPKLHTDFDINSFIKSPGNISGTMGELELSDEVKVVYTLNSVTLSENGSSYVSDLASVEPPSVWRIDRPVNGSVTDTAIDLATFSRTPATAPHAIERSSELNTNVTVRWENACKQAAPPAPVLYSFCNQALGFSNKGWTLIGIPKPDPAGTVRTQSVNKTMRVYQKDPAEQFSTLSMLLGNVGYETCNAAKVVGIDSINVNIPETRQQKCFKLTANKISYRANPLVVEDELKIFSAEDKRSFYIREKGFIQHTNLKPFESPYHTNFRSIQKRIALSMREYMRVDFLKEPVQEVTIRFSCYNTKAKDRPRLIISAYNAQGKKVDEKLFIDNSKKDEIHTIVLSGESIRHLIIYNRNFTGQILELCYIRVSRPNIEALENYLKCFRSLQLPYCSTEYNRESGRLKELIKNQDELKAYMDRKEDCAQTTFETGAFESVLFYAALHKKAAQTILVAELDDDNNILKEYDLKDLIIKEVVTPLNDLPADWLNANLPWRTSVFSFATYLQSGYFNAYDRILFAVKPSSEKTTRIRISTCLKGLGVPPLYISALEVLQLSEVQHHATVTEMQHTEQETLSGYLNDTDKPIPLLRPNKEYRMAISYSTAIYTRKNKSGSFTLKYDPADTFTQTFAFRTDNTPPLPLSPYVLGTTPAMDEQFHFFKDDLKVVFNDDAFLRMYNMYGKQLKAIIRGADGVAVNNSPEHVNITELIPAHVKTPYREAIEALINSGALKCFGEMSFPSHSAFKPPFDLKPLMPYTFDIDFDPADTGDGVTPVQPLFRRAFKTSRYADLADFVKDLASKMINHKALKNTISGIPFADPEAGTIVRSVSDIEFEQLLSGAGVSPNAAKESSGFTILWGNSSGDFNPYALLIEASEPMWRFRTESQTKPVLNEQLQEIDPNFKIYEDQPKAAMILKAKSGQNIIRQFIRNSSGMKTIALFNTISWPESGKTVTVEIEQTASTFYNLPANTKTLIELNLGAKAPWED
jgi:hypothetical protein